MNENLKEKTKSLLRIIDLRSIIGIIIILIASYGLTIAMEVVHRYSISETITWIQNNTVQFHFNYIIVLSVVALITSIVGCVYIGFSISSLLMALLSVVNLYKIKFRGDPLFPWDLLLNSEGGDMAKLVTDKTEIIILIVGFIGIIAIGFLRFILPKITLKFRYRIPLLILAGLSLYTLGYDYDFLGKNVYAKSHISKIVWAPDKSYENNGFALSFSMNFKDVFISEPQGYNKENLERIADNIEYEDSNKESVKPNVIIIMSEAFWDPTVMENLEFSKDPIPTFRDIHENYTSGWIRSSQYGGGTSNTEFEVLTGNTMNFLPTGTMAFQQYMGKPTMSMASVLRKQGYKSVGLHSYKGWFWNRIESYKNLGFDKFISLEYFKDLTSSGWYTSDEVVTDAILEEVDSSKDPLFLYAVTMENHGPYDNKRYGEDGNTIKVNGTLSETNDLVMETYSQGLENADKALNKLIKNLKEIDEPTVVVFYGDHLPMLGVNYGAYKESGFINSSNSGEWSVEETLNMEKIPFIIWDNYGKDKEDVNTLNTSFLGPYILDYIDMEIPDYFKYLRGISKKLPVIGGSYGINGNGEFVTNNDEVYKSIFNEYNLVQYDQFFGKSYLDGNKDESWIITENPDYNKELNDIVINSVAAKDNKLVIKGDKFVPSATININGNEVKGQFVDTNTFIVEDYEKDKDLDIKIELINSKGVVLAKSNVYTFEK